MQLGVAVRGLNSIGFVTLCLFLTSYVALCKSLYFSVQKFRLSQNESWTILSLRCLPGPTFYILNIYEILALNIFSYVSQNIYSLDSLVDYYISKRLESGTAKQSIYSRLCNLQKAKTRICFVVFIIFSIDYDAFYSDCVSQNTNVLKILPTFQSYKSQK